MINIDETIQKHPGLNFLKSPRILALSKKEHDFLMDCVEDVLFWIEQEKNPNASEGFKFLAAAYGLQKSQEEAKAKGLEGKDREKFLRSSQDLYSMFNPFGGIDSNAHK